VAPTVVSISAHSAAAPANRARLADSVSRTVTVQPGSNAVLWPASSVAVEWMGAAMRIMTAMGGVTIILRSNAV
jgi:hypothetical protein